MKKEKGDFKVFKCERGKNYIFKKLRLFKEYLENSPLEFCPSSCDFFLSSKW
jgi:hypothetical protein